MNVDAATLLNVPIPRWYEIRVPLVGRTDLVKEQGYMYPALYLERVRELDAEMEAYECLLRGSSKVEANNSAHESE